MPKISALPPAGTLADDDETPFVDDSAAATKKFTLAGLLVWLQSKVTWVTTAMLDDGAVTNAKLSTSAGEIGAAWQSYVPVLSGSGGSPTIGNGTITGRYIQVGKTIIGYIDILNGSTTVFGTSLTTISLPVAANNSFPQRMPIGFFETLDASPAASYIGAASMSSSYTTLQLNVLNASQTYLAYTTVTNSVPITPAVNDRTRISFIYEAA